MVDVLTELGLSTREAKLYISLLQGQEFTASELQIHTGVPRTKVYECLEKMFSRGLCRRRIEGRRRYYSAVPPDDVVKQLKLEWQNDMEQRVAKAEDALESLGNLYMEGQAQLPDVDCVEVMRNPGQIHLRFTELVKSLEREVLAFMRPPFACAQGGYGTSRR